MTPDTIDAICSLLAIAMAIIAIILANIARRIAKDSRASRLADSLSLREAAFNFSQSVTNPDLILSCHDPVENLSCTESSPSDSSSAQNSSLVHVVLDVSDKSCASDIGYTES